MLVMLFPPGHAGSPDIEAFFGSFKLVNARRGEAVGRMRRYTSV